MNSPRLLVLGSMLLFSVLMVATSTVTNPSHRATAFVQRSGLLRGCHARPSAFDFRVNRVA